MFVTWALLAVDLCSPGRMLDGTHTIRSNPRNTRGEFNYTTQLLNVHIAALALSGVCEPVNRVD
jgi:hypothetical protein